MRIFVGIVPPPELAARVLRLARELIPPLAIPRSEAHITLKAPQVVDSLERVSEILTEIANLHSPIPITLGDPQSFNKKYMAFSASGEELHVLHREIASKLADFNAEGINRFEAERYNPHMTI